MKIIPKNNPVRKNIWATSKPKVERDRTKYQRKKKHRSKSDE